MYHISDRAHYHNILCTLLGQQSKDKAKLRKSTIKFKAENDLPRDDTVDCTTFKLMVKARHEAEVRDRYPHLCRGMQSNDVAALNTMLCEILPTVSIDASLPRGGYFGEETAAAVRLLRHAFFMNNTESQDVVDPLLYERIVIESEYVRRIDDLGIFIKR